MMIGLKILFFVLGMLLVWVALSSAVKTFVVPRATVDPIVRVWFRLVRRFFNFRLRWADTYDARDRVMAYYAPIALLSLLPIWLGLVAIGFMFMFWATGIESGFEDFVLSGSSLLTLGFARGQTMMHDVLAFVEASIGLILVALLLAYLPTMYSAFSRREVAVNQLSVRAGTPPSALEFILRAQRIGELPNLRDFWFQWETWFAEIEESHTSLAALVFFRSPQPQQSWITAAGAVLDSAALLLAAVDVPNQPQAALCIRAGYLALQRIADYFSLAYEAKPQFPLTPIYITREEFDTVYAQLQAQNVPLKADREQAWLVFAGWRVNYDKVLIDLCLLTMAPLAPWSSDRSTIYRPLPLFSKKHRK